MPNRHLIIFIINLIYLRRSGQSLSDNPCTVLYKLVPPTEEPLVKLPLVILDISKYASFPPGTRRGCAAAVLR